MNKVQLISTIMKTMKDKDQIKYKVNVEASAPDMTMNFSKVVDPDKHQRKGFRGCHHHGPMMMHQGMRGEYMNKMKDAGMDKMQISWRDRLSMMSLMLDVFNSIEITDLDKGETRLHISNQQLSDELIGRIKETMEKKHKMMKQFHDEMAPDHKPHAFKKHFHEMTDMTFDVDVMINSSKEITSMNINLKGNVPDGPCQAHIEAEVI